MAKPTAPKILAAMPAYNEEKYIGIMVLSIRQYTDDILVVDDGSTDNTARIAQQAGATVIRHPGNKGKGAAIKSILAAARKQSPDILVLLDADSQHNPDEIPRLIKSVGEGYDLVIGSRLAQAEKTPRYRRVGQKILAYATRLLSQENVRDSESGFRALSRKAISGLKLKENGFAIEAEMIARAKDAHLKIVEVPISNIYTEDGSTLHPVRHGLGVLLRILAMLAERRPLFFFGLSGGILTMLGIGAGVLWQLANGGTMPRGTVLVSVFLLAIGVSGVFTGIIRHRRVNRG